MTTQSAGLDRPAVGVLHFHAAQRLIGLLGGIAFFAMIVLGVWGLRQWEVAARAGKGIAPGTVKVTGEKTARIIPPIPTFVTAGFVGADDPKPQTKEQPKRVEPEPGRSQEPPTPTYPLGQKELESIPTFGEPLGPDGTPFVPVFILRRIRAPRDAMVKAIQVKEGQIVKRGDVLMMLTSETLEWQMIEIRGHLEMAEAKFAALDQKRAFVQRLIEKNAAAQDQLTELQAEVQVAQVELKTRKSQYDLLARAQAELNILAPVEGKIEAHNLEANFLGNPVQRGELLLEIVAADGTDGRNNR